MATITKFEDLDVWKKARELATRVYSITSKGKFARDYRFRDQINAAAGSVMDNIAEGFDRGGRNEFVNFLGFSKGSAGEVKSQLYRALDNEYISKETFDDLYKLADDIGKLNGGLITYLNKSTVKGTKYKERV
ncbi:MAG TPA: four helix bundle protein [Chitinophagales bacterium]|nr:four helix bundle protein [Chitinophagales bacterium]